MLKTQKRLLILAVAIFLITSGFAIRPPLSVSVKRAVLANGLTVLVHENHELPTVTLKVRVQAGSLYEPEGKAGVSSFTARMLAKGTSSRTAARIASSIEFVGGELEAEGGGASTYVTCQVLKKDLDLGLELLSDILTDPVFPAEEVRKEKELIIARIRSREDDPRLTAKTEFDELVYGEHPFHRPLFGYEKTVKNISRKDLADFYRRYYAPNSMILAVSGDVDTRGLMQKIKDKFGGWARRPVEFPAFPPALRQDEIKKKSIFMEKEQAHIFLGHLGVRRENPDYYALAVLDVILGAGGMSSRIPYDLRDVKGLAYVAYSDLTSSAGTEPGEFEAYMAVSPENVEEAVSGLLYEIEKIRDEAVTDQELNDAKSYLGGSYYFSLQGNKALANYLIYCEVYGLGFDYAEKYPRYIAGITRKDVQRAAQKYLHPAAYTLVVVGPVGEP